MIRSLLLTTALLLGQTQAAPNPNAIWAQFLTDLAAAATKAANALSPVTPPTPAPPAPVATPTPPPPLNPGSVPILSSAAHPRFWGAAAEITDLQAKAATTEGKALIAGATTVANSATQSVDRMLCRTLLYRISGDPTMGANAAADLVALAPAAPTDSFSSTIAPAVAYDAVAGLLAATDKATVLAALQKRMDTRDNSALGLWQWCGNNEKAGDGMALALATSGDLPSGTKDYISDFWQNNWNSTAQSASVGNNFWTWSHVIFQMGDAGNNEGWGYYWNNVLPNFAIKGMWESATGGNSFLKIGWFDRYPLWWLFQMEPGFPRPAGVGGGFPWAVATGNYNSGFVNSRDAYDMLRCQTSGPNGALARWILDQTFGYTSAVSRAGNALLCGVFIGDPRVTGVDPGTLGLPLTFTKQLGDCFWRSSWAADSTVLYFGNNRSAMRSVSANGLALYKRVPLLPYRGALWDHTYEPGDFGNCLAFYSGTQRAIVSQAEHTNNTPEIEGPAVVGGSLTQNADGSYTGACIPNLTAYPGFSLSQVTRCNRTVAPSADLSTITVTDDVACDQALTPHVVWQMATQPAISPDQSTISVTGSDGLTTCALTMTGATVTCTPIGGPGHYADAFDGTTPAPSLLDATFAAASTADQLHLGGYWRVHVVLPPGGGKLQTTITVK